MLMPIRLASFLLTALLFAACSSEEKQTTQPGAESPAGMAAGMSAGKSDSKAIEASQPLSKAPLMSSVGAILGMRAPDFALIDQAGHTVRLSDFAGKPVVLEWFNPECPYVVGSHSDGTLKNYPNACVAEGVVWLAINSGAAGKQGAGLEQNAAAREAWSMNYPILFDESGAVGKSYKAKTTPHMFVINEQGLLVYRGAIDNAQEEGAGEPINYVKRALAEMKSGLISKPETKPYGCNVKYAN